MPWWLGVQLWGLEIPVVALCWAAAFIAFKGLPMVTAAPLCLLAAFAWLISPAILPCETRRMQQDSVRGGRMVIFQLLRMVVTLVAMWLLFYQVGRQFLSFAAIPLLVQGLGWLPVLRRWTWWRWLCLSAALALACAVPAAYLSILHMPLDVLQRPAAWHFGLLIFLCCLLRDSWQQEEAVARRRGLWVGAGLMLLMASCLVGAYSAPAHGRALYNTIAMTAALMLLSVHLRPRLRQGALFALGWFSLAVPPLLAILLFC